MTAQAARGAHVTERLSTDCLRGLQGEGRELKGQTSVHCDTQADPGAKRSCSHALCTPGRAFPLCIPSSLLTGVPKEGSVGYKYLVLSHGVLT